MSLKNLKNGALGGLAGGLVFGVLMGAMGMLPMIGKMAGHATATTGFVVHMLISAVIGLSFALLMGGFISSRPASIGFGLSYGAIWWLLGPLTLMPLMMGMGFGVNWSLGAASNMLPSLYGHLMYGAVLGYVYETLRSRANATRAAAILSQPKGVSS